MQIDFKSVIEKCFECGFFFYRYKQIFCEPNIGCAYPALRQNLVNLLWQAANPDHNDFESNHADVGIIICADQSMMVLTALLADQMNKNLFNPAWTRILNGNMANIFAEGKANPGCYKNGKETLEREAQGIIICEFLEISPSVKQAVRICREFMPVQKLVALVDRGNSDSLAVLCEKGKYPLIPTKAVFTKKQLQEVSYQPTTQLCLA